MNARTLLSIAAALVSLNALAESPSLDVAAPVVSTTTRAAVQAEFLQARAAGLIVHGDVSVDPQPSRSVLSRAQVRADALEAARLGLIPAGETGPQAYPVRATVIAAR